MGKAVVSKLCISWAGAQMMDVLGVFLQKVALWQPDPTSCLKRVGIDQQSLMIDSPLQPVSVRMPLVDAATAAAPPAARRR